MKIKLHLLFVVLLFSVGCFDILKEKETTIVGNISLINSANRENEGYRMVIYTNNFNKTLLDANYVEDLTGNDSILIVKCIDARKCNELYYKVEHKKGDTLLGVNIVDLGVYSNLISSMKSKYKFHAPKAACP